MKASDYIAQYLERRGVTHVFELVGGMITFLLDSIHRKSSIQLVSMHHEQAAGFAAEGLSRIAGVPGVAMATSGPGATNLLTAVGSCYFDSVPAVFITGQVNRHEQKGSASVRQLGFQETDIVSMAKPVTKAAWLVNNPDELPELLEKAFEMALSGRPGPVLLDLPMDVQRAEIADLGRLETASSSSIPPRPEGQRLSEFWDRFQLELGKARRPLILAGGGLRAGNAASAFRNFVKALGVPVVHSLMGVDLLPWEESLRAGLIGSYGNRWANIAMSESDLLLVIGSRLDVRQTGSDTEGFKGGRSIFHVDCDNAELNNRIKGCVPLREEVGPFLDWALGQKFSAKECGEWLRRIDDLKQQWPDTRELETVAGINPNEFVHRLSQSSAAAKAFVVDVGQHQMWAAQSIELGPEQRFLTSGGMGAMGFALPAGIGACLGAGGDPVVVIAGDGGFQLNIQELQTIVHHQLPIKMVVLNNQCHGMVRQFQQSYFDSRFQSTLWGYSAPSFAGVARAYGLPAIQVTRPEEMESALVKFWENPKSPGLLEVAISPEANAYPKMAFGRPIAEMEPFAQPLEMEGT